MTHPAQTAPIRLPATRLAACLVTVLAFGVAAPRAQTTWTLSSPNGGVVVSVKQDTIPGLYANQLNAYYRVKVGDSLALDWSPLGIKTSDQNFITGMTYLSGPTASSTRPIRCRPESAAPT